MGKFMNFLKYSDANSFFEITVDFPENDPDSLSLRLLCLQDFLKRAARLPLLLPFKAMMTLFRGTGVFLGLLALFLTLGASHSSREFLVERTLSLGQDLVDWLLLPVAVLSCFFRLLLGFFVRPTLYFNP